MSGRAGGRAIGGERAIVESGPEQTGLVRFLGHEAFVFGLHACVQKGHAKAKHGGLGNIATRVHVHCASY